MNYLNKWSKNDTIRKFTFIWVIIFFVWCIVTLSSEKSKSYQVKLPYLIHSENKIIYGLPQTFELTLSANGWNHYKIQRRLKKIKANPSPIQGTLNGFFLDNVELRTDIKRLLGNEVKVDAVYPSRLRLNWIKTANKKVKVMPNSSIFFPQGIGLSGSIQLSSDSITIFGPEYLIRSINSITTNKLEVTLAKSGSYEVGISAFSNSLIQLSENKVRFFVPVDKITSGKIILPVTIVGNSTNDKISLFPQKVTIAYEVAVRNFLKVKPEQFLITVDASKIAKSKNEKLVLNITKKPQWVGNIWLSPTSVNYIIEE